MQLLNPGTVVQRQRLAYQARAIGIDQQQADARCLWYLRRDDERFGSNGTEYQTLVPGQAKSVIRPCGLKGHRQWHTA
ncbi:hypothetical protein D3C84_867480 [compost metagenome]